MPPPRLRMTCLQPDKHLTLFWGQPWLLRDWVECVWAFPSTTIPSWVDTETGTDLKCWIADISSQWGWLSHVLYTDKVLVCSRASSKGQMSFRQAWLRECRAWWETLWVGGLFLIVCLCTLCHLLSIVLSSTAHASQVSLAASERFEYVWMQSGSIKETCLW